MDTRYSWTDNEKTYLLVKVRPLSKQNIINDAIEVKTSYPVNFALSVSIKAPAQDNKANKELISFMAKYLKISKNNINIVAGDKNKIKLLLIIKTS